MDRLIFWAVVFGLEVTYFDVEFGTPTNSIRNSYDQKIRRIVV